LIDIHSHVLYGVDDGARTLEESVAMVRMAAESGTTDLVATPHASPEYKYEAALIRDRLAEIAEASGNVVRLYSGCDFHLTFENIQDGIANPQKYTINQKCYLLVEFSDLLIYENTWEIFQRLQDAGMIPVITHPERNSLLRQRLDELEKWIEQGAYLQITAHSLEERFGRRAKEFCETLLDRNMVHFVASDAHDLEDRTPRLDQAFKWIKKKYGEELATLLCVSNPKASIDGAPLALPAKPLASEQRKWYQLWR
jgi:protein-tyrosine phosphatase